MKNNTDKVKKEKKTDNNEMKKIRLNIDFKKVLNKLKPKKEKVKENKNIEIRVKNNALYPSILTFIANLFSRI